MPRVDICVTGLREAEPARGYLLVTFDGRPAAAADTMESGSSSPHREPLAQQLEEDLPAETAAPRHRRACETHAEEAKASNEELQAMNEELRSSAEARDQQGGATVVNEAGHGSAKGSRSRSRNSGSPTTTSRT